MPLPNSLRRLFRALRPRVSPLARRIKQAGLTYLSSDRLHNLEHCAQAVNHERVPGIFVEAGVALGGSAILLAGWMGEERAFHGFDVFGQIPPPSDRDDEKSRERYAVIAGGQAKGIRGGAYYGYVTDLLGQVSRSFEQFNLPVDGKRIHLHQGLFEDTMHFAPGTRVALAHIDCDWYDPVKLCLARLHPLWSPGGYFLIDDYNDYGGCRQAVDEFLGAHDDVVKLHAESNLILQRRPAGRV